MSTIQSSAIVCGGCQRKFAWKPELAGKRVKCKCGTTIAVAAEPGGRAAPKPVQVTAAKTAPAASRPAPMPVKKPRAAAPVEASEPVDLDGLFALAEDADRAAAALPVEIREAPLPVIPVKTAKARTGAAPLGYQRGPTVRDRELVGALFDPVRDLYAPLGILSAGFLLYIGYFISTFHLAAGAIAPVGVGVVILTGIKAALLVGFALVAAGPLGVSFGGLWSAVLKLAAIAVFADGVTAWVDVGVGKISGGVGGGGIVTWGVIGWPVALGMYWGLLIYLFSMDPGESWLVVICLSIFDRIMRTVLALLLLATFLGWGGVTLPSSMSGGGSSRHSSSSAHNSILSTHVDEVKERDGFIEARKYIADGHQAVLNKPTEEWYGEGCPNVWFEMTGRDINGKRSAIGVIVELPEDKESRAKTYATLQDYYKAADIPTDPSEFQDTGEQYLDVMMR